MSSNTGVQLLLRKDICYTHKQSAKAAGKPNIFNIYSVVKTEISVILHEVDKKQIIFVIEFTTKSCYL